MAAPTPTLQTPLSADQIQTIATLAAEVTIRKLNSEKLDKVWARFDKISEDIQKTNLSVQKIQTIVEERLGNGKDGTMVVEQKQQAERIKGLEDEVETLKNDKTTITATVRSGWHTAFYIIATVGWLLTFGVAVYATIHK